MNPCHHLIKSLYIKKPQTQGLMVIQLETIKSLSVSSLRSIFFKRLCLLEGSSREQFILKSGHMPDSDFELSFHNSPAVFTTWLR